jgi:hypothetical protein
VAGAVGVDQGCAADHRVPYHGTVKAGHQVQLRDVLRRLTDQPRQVAHCRLVGEGGAHHGLDGFAVIRPDLLDLRHLSVPPPMISVARGCLSVEGSQGAGEPVQRIRREIR